jgi:hypothetical protein
VSARERFADCARTGAVLVPIKRSEPFALKHDMALDPDGKAGMKLRRLISLSGLVLAVAALSPATAQGASMGTDRPLKCTFTSSIVIANVLTGEATVDSTFRCTHLGHGTSHQDTTGFSTAPNTAFNTGTATYVAANGDQLFTDVEGTVTFFPTGASTATFVDTITGGTGRFADASGTFTRTGAAELVSFVFPISTSAGSQTGEGQISY